MRQSISLMTALAAAIPLVFSPAQSYAESDLKALKDAYRRPAEIPPRLRSALERLIVSGAAG